MSSHVSLGNTLPAVDHTSWPFSIQQTDASIVNSSHKYPWRTILSCILFGKHEPVYFAQLSPWAHTVRDVMLVVSPILCGWVRSQIKKGNKSKSYQHHHEIGSSEEDSYCQSLQSAYNRKSEIIFRLRQSTVSLSRYAGLIFHDLRGRCSVSSSSPSYSSALKTYFGGRLHAHPLTSSCSTSDLAKLL